MKLEWSSRNLRWLYFLLYWCVLEHRRSVLFVFFSCWFYIWPCFMYFGLCTLASVSSVALFYHGWRREKVFKWMFLRVFERLCDSSRSHKRSTADNFLVFIFISLAQMSKKKTNVGLRVSAVWKINQKIFFSFIVAYWGKKSIYMFLVFFSLKSVVKSVRISLFNLTVVWHVVNCPNRWINNLRLRIFLQAHIMVLFHPN